MTTKPAIATPETDAKLRKKFRKRGHQARELGIAREDCPVDGLLAKWWKEGWDGQPWQDARPA